MDLRFAPGAVVHHPLLPQGCKIVLPSLPSPLPLLLPVGPDSAVLFSRRLNLLPQTPLLHRFTIPSDPIAGPGPPVVCSFGRRPFSLPLFLRMSVFLYSQIVFSQDRGRAKGF